MEPIDPNTQLIITMTAAEWNSVIGVMELAPVPYKVVNPLLTKLGMQIRATAMLEQNKSNGCNRLQENIE